MNITAVNLTFKNILSKEHFIDKIHIFFGRESKWFDIEEI